MNLNAVCYSCKLQGEIDVLCCVLQRDYNFVMACCIADVSGIVDTNDLIMSSYYDYFGHYFVCL